MLIDPSLRARSMWPACSSIGDQLAAGDQEEQSGGSGPRDAPAKDQTQQHDQLDEESPASGHAKGKGKSKRVPNGQGPKAIRELPTLLRSRR